MENSVGERPLLVVLVPSAGPQDIRQLSTLQLPLRLGNVAMFTCWY